MTNPRTRTWLIGAALAAALGVSACGRDRDRAATDERGAPTAGVRGPGATGTTMPGAPPPARVEPPAPAAPPANPAR